MQYICLQTLYHIKTIILSQDFSLTLLPNLIALMAGGVSTIVIYGISIHMRIYVQTSIQTAANKNRTRNDAENADLFNLFRSH